ncbi:unnamed protein product [Merluccius merluccius]
MAYLALLEDLENRALHRERVFKERADLFSESTEWLLSSTASVSTLALPGRTEWILDGPGCSCSSNSPSNSTASGS